MVHGPLHLTVRTKASLVIVEYREDELRVDLVDEPDLVTRELRTVDGEGIHTDVP